MDEREAYGLVKGFLVAQGAPQEVLQALNRMRSPARELIEIGPRPPLLEPKEVDVLLRPKLDPFAPQKKKEMSPEQRAAAAERMRKARDAKAAKKQMPPAPEPPAPEEFIGVRADRTLLDSDWGDIQAMLAKRSREQVAANYGVTVAELDTYIARQVKVTKLPPGRAYGSSHIKILDDLASV